jgi:signal transduction histidine kinase/CheY-like chemotaxis protein
MFGLRFLPRLDPDSRELLQNTSRNLILTAFGIYMAWHFIVTLIWADTFSSRAWSTTLLMLVLTAAGLKLVSYHYMVGGLVWQFGIIGVIMYAYNLYGLPEISLLLIALPLAAMVTVRQIGTAVVLLAVLLSVTLLPAAGFIQPLPPGYHWAVFLGCVFATLFGWGLSSNLLSAIDTSSYHYRQARKLLEETRQHRGEISRMLKDQNQANYQLERLNQMLQQARVRAEEARSDRDRFILAVSHELRSPLNFILGFSDLMVNSPETYAPRQQWPKGLYEDACEIYQSSTHLLGLINDILDMGQIDARQMALIRANVRLEEVVADVLDMVDMPFYQKGLYLRTEIEPDLPLVYADATRLRQVLLNLANNSLRFTEQGGLTLSLKRQGEEVLVCAADTGSGISPEEKEKVFDEFRQVGQENWRRREGSGLGLSISRRFVELHGGKMWLESELGKGTTIYFTIPAQKAPDTAGLLPLDMETNRDRKLDSYVRKEQNILVFSDTPTEVVRFLGGCLPGCQVTTAETIEEAVALACQTYPRLLLLDLPDLEPMKPALKLLPPEIPVLAAPLLEHLHSEALPEGILRYLVKPVTRQSLLSVVAESLEGLPDGPRSLLVVDDDPAMLRFVTQALMADESGTSHYTFHTANNGEEAIHALRSRPVDLVLLDLHLPDIMGWEVLARAKREGCSARFVIVSAADQPHNIYTNGKTAFQIWLNRPVSQDDIGRVIKGLLGEKP